MDKKTIRDRAIASRAALSEAERMEKSFLILKKLFTCDAFLSAWKVGLYASTEEEVITYPLIDRAKILDKGVAMPRIESAKDREMLFRYILSVSDLKKGAFGILEPDAKATVMEHPDVIIMPLVAFDENRNRIGYGGGYYDRYLAKHPDIKTIALSFACQKTGSIPAGPHDIKPDLIITEDNIYD